MKEEKEGKGVNFEGSVMTDEFYQFYNDQYGKGMDDIMREYDKARYAVNPDCKKYEEALANG